GRRVVSGSADNTVTVWDLTVSQGPRVLKGSHLTAMSLAVMPDGKHVLRSGWRDGLTFEDPDTGEAPRKVQVHAGVLRIAVTPSRNRSVGATMEKTVKVWDADTCKELVTLNGHTGMVRGVAFNPDGKRIVTGGEDKTVKIWDTDTGKEIRTLNGHTD